MGGGESREQSSSAGNVTCSGKEMEGRGEKKERKGERERRREGKKSEEEDPSSRR